MTLDSGCKVKIQEIWACKNCSFYVSLISLVFFMIQCDLILIEFRRITVRIAVINTINYIERKNKELSFKHVYDRVTCVLMGLLQSMDPHLMKKCRLWTLVHPFFLACIRLMMGVTVQDISLFCVCLLISY